MSDDWKAGDIAVCIDDSPSRMKDTFGQPFPLRAGSVWRVIAVTLSRFGYRKGEPLLHLKGAPPPMRPYKSGAFHTERFRKLRPATDEFVEQMHSLVPDMETAFSRADREADELRTRWASQSDRYFRERDGV